MIFKPTEIGEQTVATPGKPEEINKSLERRVYPTEPYLQQWYQAMPYSFTFTDRDGYCYRLPLPINPKNLTIVTHFATNIVPTLYGTVEEHSEQRYFDISIEGNTGIAPKWTDFVAYDPFDMPNFRESKGRKNVTASALQTGGFGGKVVEQIQAGAKSVGNILKAFGLGSTETGIYTKNTGYAAFHRLYKMFLYYKKAVTGDSGKGNPDDTFIDHPMYFECMKDRVKYQVVPTKFQINRNANSPMLYNYSIILRAYNIQPLSNNEKNNFLAERFEALGLNSNGVKADSAFNTASNVLRNSIATIGAVKGIGSLL